MGRTQDTWERVPLVGLHRCWGLGPQTGWGALSGNACVFLSAATRAHISAPIGVPREEVEACGSHRRLRQSAGQRCASGGPRAKLAAVCAPAASFLLGPLLIFRRSGVHRPPEPCAGCEATGPLGGGVAVTHRPQARVGIAKLSLHVAPFFLEFLPR